MSGLTSEVFLALSCPSVPMEKLAEDTEDVLLSLPLPGPLANFHCFSIKWVGRDFLVAFQLSRAWDAGSEQWSGCRGLGRDISLLTGFSCGPALPAGAMLCQVDVHWQHAPRRGSCRNFGGVYSLAGWLPGRSEPWDSLNEEKAV